MIEDYQKAIIWLSTIKGCIEPTGGVPYPSFDEKGYKILDDILYKSYEEDGYVERIHNELMDLSKTNKNIESYYLNKEKVEAAGGRGYLLLFFDMEFLAIIEAHCKMWFENELQNLADRAKNQGYKIVNGKLVPPK
jgi:hypothetical protein|tara:strand:- start:97 stop:504 length:408 start_codon:yes stop_codon:yes gene_type:complete